MKIGILTFHRAHNYGAVLQCFALQNVLKNLGHDVKIIDFVPPSLYGYYDYRIFSRPFSPKNIIGRIIKYFSNKKRTERFNEFLNSYLNLTQKIETISELKTQPFDFDAVICGSDQVWNANIVGSVMEAYYLDFVGKGTKKIAYSASYEQIEASKKHKEQIKRYLQSFDAVSLREDNGLKLTSRLWGKRACKTLDPSLLLTQSDYDKMAQPVAVPKRYMLVYTLGKNKCMERCIRRWANRFNMPVVNLGRKIHRLPRGSKYFKSIGPKEFIYLMHNANCVCTNSFHGTCFSIIYKKPFVTFDNKGKSARLINLLKTFNLQNRMVWRAGKSMWRAANYLKVGCEVPDYLIDYHKNKSVEFLKKALK